MCLIFTATPVSVIVGQDLLFKGVVCNSIDKTPIPYATIRRGNSHVYKDADDLGQFEILAKVGDSLIVPSIGFRSGIVVVFLNGLSGCVSLQPSFSTSPVITITRPTVETFGTVGLKVDRTCSGGDDSSRYEVATLIEVPDIVKYYRVSKLIVKGKGFGVENPIRLHVYSVDSNGLPGRELLSKDIVIVTKEGDGNLCVVDIRDQNVFIAESSFFVGYQWLGTRMRRKFIGPELCETFRGKKLLTYRRNLGWKRDGWYGWFDKDIVFFPGGTVPANAKPINVLASAEIEVFEKL